MINLLYIEDDPADFLLVSRHLQRMGMETSLVRVDDLQRLSQALDETAWDGILADYRVPGMVFEETLELVCKRIPDCPLILISGSVGEEKAVDLLKKGVWDFVLKDNLARLCPALERGFRDSESRRARRVAEQALRESQERLRLAATVFESTRDGVMITDMDSRLLAINKAFTEITGYVEAEALGKSPSIMRSGRHSPEFFQTMWAFLRKTGQWQGEIWNRRKNGEIYPAWMSISTVRDERGCPTHYVGVFSDISQLKRSEEQLVHLAHYDPLTGLPNRLLLQSRLEHAIERAARRGQRAAALFIDLDRFKTVNDSLGHVFGDQLLVDVAKRLGERIRSEDTLGRFGGDEFLLLLEPIEHPDEAAIVARDILSSLAAPFQLAGSKEIYVGASIGISIFPIDGITVIDLLRDADAAMHQAKHQGRGQFCFYTADMNVNAIAQLELEAALRRAVERKEFVLHYQPKVDMRSGRIVGAEALIRWRREDGGMVSPGDFIPLAEKNGLIVPIGNWVIDEGCRQLREWQGAGMTDLRLSVNVSARQFYSDELVDFVARTLERHSISPSKLELEVTESMLMVDPEQTISILDALKRIGVKLSLDDFGTGYSSFAYLSRFRIDTLKIDQSFVNNVVTEPEAAMIAVSIIDLAHRMQINVVAEGVETEAQFDYLRMRNCDEMQGYYFAAALPADEFAALVNRDGMVLLSQPGLRGETTAIQSDRSSQPVAEVPRQRTILLVDDEESILSSLRRLLRASGYRILTAISGQAGLELLAKNEVDVILSDQRMPNMTGVEFLRRVKTIHPETVRIVLSGYTELQSITDAINEGAIYKFLTKPWDDDLLRANIEEAFRYKQLADENQRLRTEEQVANKELLNENMRLREALAEKASGSS